MNPKTLMMSFNIPRELNKAFKTFFIDFNFYKLLNGFNTRSTLKGFRSKSLVKSPIMLVTIMIKSSLLKLFLIYEFLGK